MQLSLFAILSAASLSAALFVPVYVASAPSPPSNLTARGMPSNTTVPIYVPNFKKDATVVERR